MACRRCGGAPAVVRAAVAAAALLPTANGDTAAPAAGSDAELPSWDFILPQHENRDFSGRRPLTRYSHTVTAIGEEVVVTFGYFYDHWDGNGPTWHRDAWALATKKSIPAEKRWRCVNRGVDERDAPPRMNHAAVLMPVPGTPGIIGSKTLVVFGGSDVRHEKLNDMWELDVSTGSWMQRLPANEPPAPRCSFSAVVLGSALFIYGGFHMGDLWRFTFNDNRWELLMPAPEKDHSGHPGKRAAHGAVAAPNGRDMYVYGGFRFEADVSDPGLGHGKLKDLWLFTSDDNRWHLLPQVSGDQGGRQFFDMMLVPWREAEASARREGEDDAASGHGLAVFAGNQCNPNCSLVGSLTVYSLQTKQWFAVGVKEEPLHRYHSGTALSEGALWTFGGESYTPHMYHNSVQRLAWPPLAGAVSLASAGQGGSDGTANRREL